MGKIKSKAIKNSAKTLVEKGIEFTGKFEENKKILGNIMPSKKIRNQVAGFLARIKKQNQSKILAKE